MGLQFTCLFCQSMEAEVKEVIFQGMHILADCSCSKCSREFYHTLPIGHDRLFPLSFDKEGGLTNYDKKAAKWLAEPLIDSFFKHPKEEAEIEKKVLLKKESAVVLNCLDSCYGHVLIKLWNAKRLIDAYPGMGIIVLIPKNVEWLVPFGVAEIWIIGRSLSRFKSYIANLDWFVKKEFSRFKKVYLSPAHIHVDTSTVGIEAYLKVREFNLLNFSSFPPHITFILRNDRFWHGNPLELFLYNVCMKYNMLGYFRRYFVWRQNGLVNKVAGQIREQLLDVNFFAVGIGKRGGLSSLIEDLRGHNLTDTTEKEWCGIYAKSNIVIGIHGSNMLIPTALAAGFIELLPRHKIPHLTEDLTLQQHNAYSLFLGRHLDHYAPASLIALHAVSMVRDFPSLYENTEKNK